MVLGAWSQGDPVQAPLGLGEWGRVAVDSLQLRPMAQADIAAVVQLHREALPYSLNSRLGASHLAQVYAVMSRESASLVMVACRDGAPVGVVSAAVDPAAVAARILSGLTPRRWAGLVSKLMLRPGLLWAAMESQRMNRPARLHGRVIQPCLTAIAVAASGRRAGIGRQLVGAVEGFFRQQGCSAYYLDTLAKNAAAQAFYARLGFVEAERRGSALILVKELVHDASAG